jgi:hypothetical protein
MGGSVSNRMAGGVIGASIAGGDNSLGAANRIDANYGSIGGGFGNTIMSGSIDSTIGGGSGNIIPTAGEHATVPGGDGNLGGLLQLRPGLPRSSYPRRLICVG